MSNKFHNFKYIFFLILPIIAVAVWYSPVIFKGYSTSEIGFETVLGKNLAKTGMYAMENDLNVLLSSSMVKETGHLSFMENKLTAYFYSLIFKVFGFLSWNWLILFSIALNALTLLIFAFLVFYLFNFRTSLVFSLIYIFFPFVWRMTIYPGFYEFALFFLSLFFLFYFLGKKLKRGFALLVLSGLFLVLAALAREALLLFIPAFFLYLLFMKEKRTIVAVFIPIVIVLSVFFLPNFFSGRNVNLQLLPVTKITENLESNDFIFYGEFYPDPYTYHFDKESFLNDYAKKRDNAGLIQSLYLRKGAVNNVKIDHLSFGHRVLLSLFLFAAHFGKFVSLEDVGGPIIFLFMLLGLYYLRKKDQSFFWMSIFLVLGTVFVLSFVVLAGRDHLMDFGWILALLAALGLLSLLSVIEAHFKLDGKKTFLVFAFVLAMVLYGLLLADHVYWGRVYDNKENLMVLAYASKMEKLNISDKDVIALGSGSFSSALSLNYLEDKSIVVFSPDTIKKLLKNGKLNFAFKKFGVTHIVGYSEKLSKEILSNSKVVNICTDDISNASEAVIENQSVKSWLMNLIK